MGQSLSKGPKGERRPADVNARAVMIAKIATGEIEDKVTEDGKNAAAVALGRMGGKGLDGRIDDPNAGWKGRGLWSTNGDRTPWLKEGGKGTKPRAVHIQVRPSPLAH
jgi:hypothetical protein